jgi:hypothetical protein
MEKVTLLSISKKFKNFLLFFVIFSTLYSKNPFDKSDNNDKKKEAGEKEEGSIQNLGFFATLRDNFLDLFEKEEKEEKNFVEETLNLLQYAKRRNDKVNLSKLKKKYDVEEVKESWNILRYAFHLNKVLEIKDSFWYVKDLSESPPDDFKKKVIFFHLPEFIDSYLLNKQTGLSAQSNARKVAKIFSKNFSSRRDAGKFLPFCRCIRIGLNEEYFSFDRQKDRLNGLSDENFIKMCSRMFDGPIGHFVPVVKNLSLSTLNTKSIDDEIKIMEIMQKAFWGRGCVLDDVSEFARRIVEAKRRLQDDHAEVYWKEFESELVKELKISLRDLI